MGSNPPDRAGEFTVTAMEPLTTAQTRAFLVRLAVTEPTAPDLATLNRLIAAHVKRIMFHGVDAFLGRSPSLVTEDIFRKVVELDRGGYCFELNTLFARLLTALGYRVQLRPARVRWRFPTDDKIPLPVTHVLICVELGEPGEGRQYLVDVGFGSVANPFRAIPVSEDFQETAPYRVRLLDSSSGAMELALLDRRPRATEGRWRCLYDVDRHPMEIVDLVPLNWYGGTHPDSVFRRGLIAGRWAGDFWVTLRNNCMIRRWPSGEAEESRTIGSADEVVEFLEKEFGLALDHDTEVEPLRSRLEEVIRAEAQAQPERLTAETTEPRKSALKTRTPGASATLPPDARGATLSPTAGPSNWAGSGAATTSTDHAEGGTAAPKAITTRTRSTAAPSAPRATEQEARGPHLIGVVTPPVPSAGTFSPAVFAATFRGRSSEPSSPSPYHSSRRPTPPKIEGETLPSSAVSPGLPGSASPPNSDPFGQEQTFSDAVDNLGDGAKKRKPSVRFGHATILEITRDYMSALEGYRPLLFFILVLLAVLFVSVVGLTVVLSLHAHQPLYLKACPTQACNRAAHDMDRLLDSSTDPCDDFHAHVCRRLNHRGARFLEGVADKMLAYINESLSDRGHVYQGSPRLKHIAQFYQLCQRFFAIEIPSNDVFGSIPRFEEVLGPASNLSTVLKRLIYLSLSRGVRNIIDIHLVRTEGTVQLRVNQGISLARKCHSEVPPTLASYLGALARSMGPVGGMPLKLSDILETDAFMERHRSRKAVEGRFNVSVLDSLIVSMKRDFWMAEFNSHIPRQHQLTENSVIGIDDLGSVRAVLRFVEGLPDYGAVYIYFQFILEALRFDYLRLFNAHGTKAVVKACLQATRSVIRDAASDIVNNLLYKQVSDPVARELFTEVLGSLRLTSDFSWMGEDMKHQAERTLHGVALYDYNFSLSASRAVSAGGDEHEAQLNVVRDLHKFPTLFLELKSQLQASFLVDPPRVEVEEYVDLFLFGTGVAYDGITNTVRIPAALRREPVLYASDVPLEYSLGTLGALVAKELVRAEVSSSNQGIRTERERVALFKYRQCIEVLARTVLNVNVNRSEGDRVPEYYYWMQGARTAYNALNAAYVRRRHAVNWDVFWKSAQRTFFKRFCLLSCNADQERGEQNTSKLHCFLPLLNMKEFSEAFECQRQPHVRSRNYCRLE